MYRWQAITESTKKGIFRQGEKNETNEMGKTKKTKKTNAMQSCPIPCHPILSHPIEQRKDIKKKASVFFKKKTVNNTIVVKLVSSSRCILTSDNHILPPPPLLLAKRVWRISCCRTAAATGAREIRRAAGFPVRRVNS